MGTMERFDDKRQTMLVLFIHNHIGGAMTALTNFVNALDTSKYHVDLLFYEIQDQVEGIKPEINILPQADTKRRLLRKLASPAYVAAFAHAQYYLKFRHSKLLSRQLRARQGCRFSRRLNKEYDIAISFELLWPFYYMVRFVRAKKKLVWHHNDYHAMGYRFSWDKRYFDQVDGLVFVSRECQKKFVALHPAYHAKCFFMPNIMAKAPVVMRAKAYQPELPFKLLRQGLNLVTVARFNFASKGMDRMIGVLCRLRDEGLSDRLRWLLIGGGNDLARFCAMVEENGLQEVVYTIGPLENPLPYLPFFDAFLLPSRNEGKPVAVTEAQILGLPPVVTRYASACEQIEDGVDGFIVDNDDQALYRGLRELVLYPEKLRQARQILQTRSYTNEADISCFDQIIQQLSEDTKGSASHDLRHSAGL